MRSPFPSLKPLTLAVIAALLSLFLLTKFRPVASRESAANHPESLNLSSQTTPAALAEENSQGLSASNSPEDTTPQPGIGVASNLPNLESRFDDVSTRTQGEEQKQDTN